MPKFIDARGKACPMPVVLAKREIDSGEINITVAVDNEMAVENLKRLATNSNIEVRTEQIEDGYNVIFSKGAETDIIKESSPKKGYTVFFGKDYVGEWDYTLGHSLAKMMLYTLSDSDDIPESVIFMNSGVKLPTSDKLDIIKSISTLEEKGTEVLVCGTCLNFYGIAGELKAGTISNMYEILEKMKGAEKVITV